ncbi:hypothetical protein [Paraglaciecola sp. 2405UD69-4]|uniref:hypothetical protein n=1 Tax=Paraglaciecola sp. 2405UD69-4 TaxID=3391836 RepID=UPI0039C9F1C7
MFRLLKYLAVFLLVIILLVTGLFLFSLESKPSVDISSAAQVDKAESVKALMYQLQDTLKYSENKQDITITEEQLNSLVGFVQRAHHPFHGMAVVTPVSSQIVVSYQLPSNPIGEYLNVEASLLPSSGVAVEYVKIGSIAISGDLALTILVKLANWYTDSDIATEFIQLIDKVVMKDKSMVFTMLPLQSFLKSLSELGQDEINKEEEELRLATAFYLRKVSELSVSQRNTPQSLAKYMRPVFSLAKDRSTSDESAAMENKAAIMALAIYVGHYKFASLVGDVQPNPPQIVLPNAKAVLKSRDDLNQHFIYSAALNIYFGEAISLAIGEFKELMDRSDDGSGYSFVDLAADYSGIKFAKAATNPKTARHLQDILAVNLDEKLFFPDVSGLPEGLHKQEFERRFTEVDSPAYQQMITFINQSVAELVIQKYAEFEGEAL